MKKTAIALPIIICVSIFCQALQQSSEAAQETRGTVSADIADSDAFLQLATRAPISKRDNSRRVEAMLARMTLEEKIGQMTQLELGMVSSGRDQNVQIDPAKLEKAILKYGVGSILNVKDQALPVETWLRIIQPNTGGQPKVSSQDPGHLRD